MISVAEAQALALAVVDPVGAEVVPLAEAAGRVLAAPARAERDQPPFDASAMDGYAVRDADAAVGARLRVVGTSAAGHGWGEALQPGCAVRIFTGAPVPPGADRVVMQEDVERDGDDVILGPGFGPARHIRARASDFAVGTEIAAGTRISAAHVTWLAAMNVDRVSVARRPVVALMSTGDELVMPGEAPGPDQIIASNGFGLAAIARAEGAEVRHLPIARDTAASLRGTFELARGADLIVTIGGASVGDLDLVGPVAAELGMEQAFYKVAMRPGKPLMAGKLLGAGLLGLPGNPVSSIVGAHVFMSPMIRRMLGLAEVAPVRARARLNRDLGENGPREHFMRARVDGDAIDPFDRQDSALISVLAEANALLVRPPNDGPRAAGEMVDYLPL